jgi:hypothetical protein
MTTNTTQDTLLDRTVTAMTEAIMEDLAERHLTLQDALEFLCAGVGL